MKHRITDPLDIIPVIDADELMRGESAALSQLSILTGPDPNRFPLLFPDPYHSVPGTEICDALSPLEKVTFDFFQEVSNQGSLKKFCKDLGGVFSATNLARRAGVAYNVVRSPDSPIEDDDLSEYVFNILRIGLIGESEPEYRSTISEIGIHSIGRILSILDGRTTALNDFMYERRHVGLRPNWRLKYQRKDIDPCQLPRSYFDHFEPKNLDYPEQVESLFGRIQNLCPDPTVRKLAAWQVCKWIHTINGYPYREIFWIAATPAEIWRWCQRYLTALDRFTNPLIEIDLETRRSWIDYAFRAVRALFEVLRTKDTSTPAQMKQIERIFQESRYGRRRSWIFDLNCIKDVTRTINLRVTELERQPEGTDAIREEWGGCVGSTVPLESSSPAELPYDRFLNDVIERHDDLDYIENGIMTRLCYELAERFRLVTLELRQGAPGWGDFGTASKIFRKNLSLSLNLTEDPGQRTLVVDIALDHLTRIYDCLWELAALQGTGDLELFEAFTMAQRRNAGRAGPIPEKAPGATDEPGSDGATTITRANPFGMPAASDATERIARKNWILQCYPDDSPEWWADLEDRLVDDLNGLDANPWVVQKIVRRTANWILHTEEYNYHFTEWTGFSPPEIFRQAMLTLGAARKVLKRASRQGSSTLILQVAPYIARMQDQLLRPGVMNDDQEVLYQWIPIILERGPTCVGLDGRISRLERYAARWLGTSHITATQKPKRNNDVSAL